MPKASYAQRIKWRTMEVTEPAVRTEPLKQNHTECDGTTANKEIDGRISTTSSVHSNIPSPLKRKYIVDTSSDCRAEDTPKATNQLTDLKKSPQAPLSIEVVAFNGMTIKIDGVSTSQTIQQLKSTLMERIGAPAEEISLTVLDVDALLNGSWTLGEVYTMVNGRKSTIEPKSSLTIFMQQTNWRKFIKTSQKGAHFQCMDNVFPEPTGIHINMMPFIIGDHLTIPEEYRGYSKLIDRCRINNEEEQGKVGYLTIDERPFLPGTSQRRAGLKIESPGKQKWFL